MVVERVSIGAVFFTLYHCSGSVLVIDTSNNLAASLEDDNRFLEERATLRTRTILVPCAFFLGILLNLQYTTLNF